MVTSSQRLSPVAAASSGELIDRARHGESDALEELIRACQGYLLLIANEELDARLRAKLGASDVVQNTLIRVEQHISDFRGTSSRQLLAWLRQILRNEVNMAYRTYVQTGKRSTHREVPAYGDSAQLDVPLVAGDPTPCTNTLMQEEALVLRDALHRLSPLHRRVVVLRNWERLTFEEIGRRLDRSADAVKKLWARALLKLREELSRE